MLVQVGPHNWHMVTEQEREYFERRAAEFFNRVEIDQMSLPQAETACTTTAPKVTKADIEAQIKSIHFINAHDAVWDTQRMVGGAVRDGAFAPWELQVLTICLMVMRNGFTVVGKSACVSPENYDKAMGERIARDDAIDQVWALMGYSLRDKLHKDALRDAG